MLQHCCCTACQLLLLQMGEMVFTTLHKFKYSLPQVCSSLLTVQQGFLAALRRDPPHALTFLPCDKALQSQHSNLIVQGLCQQVIFNHALD